MLFGMIYATVMEKERLQNLNPLKDSLSATSIVGDVLALVLVSLRYYAKGDFYSEVGDLHGISRASVSRCVMRVSHAIVRDIDNIKFPTTKAELSKIKKGFYNIAKVPNVIGAVDGTLIPIIAPKENEPVYVCRKGYHSLNIQAVVDHEMRCLHKTGGCLPFTPERSAIVVTAVFKLNKKCIDDKLPLPDLTDEFIDNGDNHIVRDIAPANVQTLRERIIQRFA